MKFILLTVILVINVSVHAQQHKLEKIWETNTVIAVPESVLVDARRNILFVSLIDGASWEADGKGGIGKLSAEGRKYDPTWITGMNAPKGMGILNRQLYVADMSEVVVIDIDSGRVLKKISPEGAMWLNDVTVSNKGIVYVSDSKTGRVWRIEKDSATVFLDNVKDVNGLKAIDDDLLIASGKKLLKANNLKTTSFICELPQNIDGIESVGNSEYLVTSWSGYIFYVNENCHIETLLDSHLQKKNAADIGYDPVKAILYVPTFNAKTVTAYRVR